MTDKVHGHGLGLPLPAPSAWVVRFSSLIRPQGRVADVACGQGRHVRFLRERGYRVLALDRDRLALDTLVGLAGVETLEADIEVGPWPLERAAYDGVVVTNYLWRPLMPQLLSALRPGGVLIYETFALGNGRYGRPANPDFLLRPNELLEWCLPALQVVAFEQGDVSQPKPAVVQRICAMLPGEAPASAEEPVWARI